LRSVVKAGLGRRCYVISPDPAAGDRARRLGVRFLRESAASGVNGAVRVGMRHLKGADTFVVIPSDLPLLSPSDITWALGFVPSASVVVVPSSSFSGTNLLLFPRRMGPLLSYDDNSFWNHLAAAARLRLRTAVLTQRNLVCDIDTREDAEDLVRLHINTGAARFLRKSLAK